MLIINGSGRSLEVDEDEYMELVNQVLVDDEGLFLGTVEQWIQQAALLNQNPGYILNDDEDDFYVVLEMEDEVH